MSATGKRARRQKESESDMTREKIESTFRLFGTIIPATSADATRRRTSYFYRREAISWARMARQWWPSKDMRGTSKRLALHYLELYRQAKTITQGTA